MTRVAVRGSRFGSPAAALAKAGLLLMLVFTCSPAFAHPAPFSYLDIHLSGQSVEGTLILHDFDVAHELGVSAPDDLLDPGTLLQYTPRITGFVSDRIQFVVDGHVVPLTVIRMRPLPDRNAIELAWRAGISSAPGHLFLRGMLFPYDPNHQTFVNVYENGRLARQYILGERAPTFDYYPGTRQGAWAVFTAFTASGIHHIAIGPDHILFIIGLLLLGGSIARLLGIVSAFTLGHSITLSLAAVGVVTPPARLVEPAIALSIVYVGADNLLAGGGRDVRPWIALFFGLVHGFGFASVLREIGLPPRALGISLFSFNLGVEIGQAIIVVIVAAVLGFVRTRSPRLALRLAHAGSIVVILAGAYWFIQRIV